MTDIFSRLLTDALTVEYSKIVKKMLKKGLSLDDIADLTDIDIIKELQEQEFGKEGEKI